MAVTCLKISHTRIITFPTHKPVSKKKKTGGFYLQQAEIQILLGVALLFFLPDRYEGIQNKVIS